MKILGSIFLFYFSFSVVLIPSIRAESASKSALSLVVVHPTNYFAKDEAKSEINKYVQEAVQANQKVLTLVESDQIRDQIISQSEPIKRKPSFDKNTAENYLYFLSDIRKTSLIVSQHGENNIELDSNRVTIIGGYLGACLKTALRSLVKKNVERFSEIHVNIPLEAIYGKERLYAQGRSLKEAIENRVKPTPPQQVTARIFLNGEKILTRGGGPYKINIYITGKNPPKGEHRNPSSSNLFFQ